MFRLSNVAVNHKMSDIYKPKLNCLTWTEESSAYWFCRNIMYIYAFQLICSPFGRKYPDIYPVWILISEFIQIWWNPTFGVMCNMGNVQARFLYQFLCYMYKGTTGTSMVCVPQVLSKKMYFAPIYLDLKWCALISQKLLWR